MAVFEMIYCIVIICVFMLILHIGVVDIVIFSRLIKIITAFNFAWFNDDH